MQLFTLGDVARKFGVQWWQVNRVYRRKLLPEPRLWLAGARIVTAAELPAVKAALKKAGYIKGGK